jgi:hypothetical protein
MKDSLILLDIYKRYLSVTHDMIVVLERCIAKKSKVASNKILIQKYREFEEHSRNMVEDFNTDLHKLIRLDSELKRLEEDEK